MNIDQIRFLLIYKRLGISGELITQRLQYIKEQAFIEKQKLIAENPNWKFNTDIRLSSLTKFINICDRTQFSLDILGKMLDDDWCDINLDNNFHSDSDYKITLAVEFEKSTKFGFGLSIFMLIEFSLRIFLRSLDSTACNGGTAAFDAIYNCLLGSKQLNFLTNDRTFAVQVLDFVRIIRNLIHNDGVYFNEKGRNEIVIYRGVQYQLICGEPVNFVSWALLLNLAEDIYKLLILMIHHPKITIKSQIIDPFEIYFS